MHYLKCKNCQNLTVIEKPETKNCSSCGEELPQNYEEWSKGNPGKSFKEFQNTICILQGEVLEEQKNQTAGKRRDWRTTVIAVLSSIIFIFLGKYSYNYIKTNFFEEQASSFDKFEKKYYKNMEIEIESPVSLTPQKITLPEQITSLLERCEHYTYENSRDFSVTLSHAVYKPKVGKANLQGAVAGTVNSMKMNPKVKNFTHRESATSKKSIPGIMVKSQFTMSKKKIEAISAIYAKNLQLWQVYVSYREEDEGGRQAAQRIIDSVKIKNQEE